MCQSVPEVARSYTSNIKEVKGKGAMRWQSWVGQNLTQDQILPIKGERERGAGGRGEEEEWEIGGDRGKGVGLGGVGWAGGRRGRVKGEGLEEEGSEGWGRRGGRVGEEREGGVGKEK